MIDGPTFVDTNVLAYAHDAGELIKQPVAKALLERLWTDGSGQLSTQVLQEFYVVVTRKFQPPIGRAEARELIALYATWSPIGVDVEMILDAAGLEDRVGLSFWDALIVEAARRGGAVRMVSEDFGDRRQVEGLAIENPFEVSV